VSLETEAVLERNTKFGEREQVLRREREDIVQLLV
jgi:hypothetical protein